MGAFTEVVAILKTEGVRGLYRGLAPELCKIIPMVGTTFAVYELMKDWLDVGQQKK